MSAADHPRPIPSLSRRRPAPANTRKDNDWSLLEMEKTLKAYIRPSMKLRTSSLLKKG